MTEVTWLGSGLTSSLAAPGDCAEVRFYPGSLS